MGDRSTNSGLEGESKQPGRNEENTNDGASGPETGNTHESLGRTRYSDLYDFAPFGYLILNDEGLIKEVNVAGAHMLGMERPALADKPIWSFVTPESRDALHLCLTKAFQSEGKGKCDLKIARADGDIFYALLEARRSLPVPGQSDNLWWCVMTDITERKQAEEVLRATRDFNRSLFVASIDPFATVDLEGKITDANPAFENITGYARQELIGGAWADSFTEPEKAVRGYEMVLEGNSVRDFPLMVRHKLGHLTPVLCNASVYHSEKREVAGVFAAARDVSERKRVEADRFRLAAVVEQTHENVVVTDRNWKITYVNSAFEKTMGYTRLEVVGKGIAFLGNETQGSMFYRPIRDALQNGRTWTGRRTGRRKDGSFFEAEVSMSPIREESGEIEGYVAIARDITEQLKLEEQLRQSQKMEAIGTLAGGIAHDFNNILAGILGFTEMALDDTPGESAVARHLRLVLKGALRGRELVKQILAFSRKGAYEKKLLNASPLIKETLKLLRASLPSTIEIKFTTNVSSDAVFADPSQLQQILVNLATNGSQAMGENGGTLEISLSDRDLGPDSLPDPDMATGDYLQLTVKDNGTGMNPETMGRVFEPFFTTKTASRGTGLGLAVVFGIAKDLRGSIAVESKPGHGSSFQVLIPKGKPEMEQEKRPGTTTLRGDERILFVDDEENLGEWAKAALERFGYRVTAISDSRSALDTFLADPSEFDLIITDQTMPGMTGKQLSREIMKAHPHMPVILCTGHSDNVSPATTKEEGIRELLMKPLSKKELAEAIRRVLDDQGAPK